MQGKKITTTAILANSKNFILGQMKHSCALIINYLDFIYALYIEDNAMMKVFMIFANEIHKIVKICPFL